MPSRPLPLIPVACTLSATDGAAQAAAWQAYRDAHQVALDRQPGRLVVHFRNDEGASGRLAELVDIERACCAFAEWSIEVLGGELRLTISGDDEALRALMFLDRTR